MSEKCPECGSEMIRKEEEDSDIGTGWVNVWFECPKGCDIIIALGLQLKKD